MNFKYRPCETTKITSGYGYRADPITGEIQQLHLGLDISPVDKVKYFQEPIFACGDGKVILAGFNTARGKQVLIDHGAGVVTRSQHLASYTVKESDIVVAGQVIGLMGDTGKSTAQHLHFEIIINGNAVNPQAYIQGLPIPRFHSDNYKRVQEKYGFVGESMEYLESYKYADPLFAKMLLPLNQQEYQLDTVKYILNYKYGRELFQKLDE